MAEFAHQRLDVGGDHRLVLDDQDIGRQLRVDFGLGFADQLLDLVEGGVEDLGRLTGSETFQGGEQERLARTGRNAHQPVGRIVGLAGTIVLAALELGAGGAPDGVEHMIERDPRREAVVEGLLAGRQGLQGHADVIVAGPLIACQGASVSTDIGQVRRKPLEKTHLPSEIEKNRRRLNVLAKAQVPADREIGRKTCAFDGTGV